MSDDGLHIHIQPDRDKREQIAKEGEQAKVQSDLTDRTQVMRVGKMGDMTIRVNTDVTPVDKIKQDRIDAFLTQKAESRQPECWAFGCNRHATVWVRQVRFDIGEGSSPMEKAYVDSSHYPGPVPGFCIGHLASDALGPARLATMVYFDHDVMTWGFRPSRWWVLFTDGTKVGGECAWIDPTPVSPTVTDRHNQAKESVNG